MNEVLTQPRRSTGGHRLRSSFWPLAAVFVIAIFFVHAAGFYFYGHDRMLARALTFATSTAERVYALDRLLAEDDGSEPDQRHL